MTIIIIILKFSLILDKSKFLVMKVVFLMINDLDDFERSVIRMHL